MVNGYRGSFGVGEEKSPAVSHTEVENEWSYASTLPYAFMLRLGIIS
jgi:hypothetical protein